MKQGQPVIMPGDGTSLWVSTWNADFAKGFLGLLGNKNAIGEAFHITSDEVLSWEQIYFEIAQALGVDPNVVHIPSDYITRFDPDAIGTLIGDKSNSVIFDNSKIKRFVSDYACEVKWKDGLQRSLAWFEAHPEFQSIDDDALRQWDQIFQAYTR